MKFFTLTTPSFIQEKNISPPSAYVIGPGDVIKIILFGTTNKQLNLKVNSEGEIIFPEIDLDKIPRITGMDITFVTTAKTDEEAYYLLKSLGLPLKPLS